MAKINKYFVDQRLYQLNKDRRWLADEIITSKGKPIGYQRLSDVLNNRGDVQLSTVSKIAKAIKAEPGDLIMGDVENDKSCE